MLLSASYPFQCDFLGLPRVSQTSDSFLSSPANVMTIVGQVKRAGAGLVPTSHIQAHPSWGEDTWTMLLSHELIVLYGSNKD